MMKPVRTLAAAIAAASLSTAYAGEAVFYVTEDGAAASNLAVTVDGKKKLVGKSGFVSFDLDGGNHSVEISEFGEWVGDFEFNAAKNQNAEIQVEMIGGEAVEEVSVYTPGQEQAPAVGKISGNLESEETGGGVAGARISIEGTDLATTTDNDGYYELELPRGEYTLTIADPNYGKREVKNLRVMSNVATSVNMTMSLSGDGVIEEVVAVGSYIPSTATAQERDSSAVLDAIGSEQFARFGDSNAASALKRVAGVSVVGGQFAVVRGMQGRYISSTLNGSLMPSTDPMRRDVPLDLFPASILGGIDIQKSFTPDMPGDSTGGAIGMSTKGMPDETGGKASVSLGFNNRTTFNDAASYKGGGSDWLGMDDGTREEPSSMSGATNGGLQSITRNTTTAGAISASDDFEHSLSVNETEARPDQGFSISYGDVVEGNNSTTGMYGALQYSDKWSVRHDAKLNDVDGVGEYDRSKRNVDLSGYFYVGSDFGDYSLNSKTIVLRKTDDTTKVTHKLDTDLETKSYTLQWVERQFLSQQFEGDFYFSFLGEDKLSWNVGVAQTTRDEPDRRTYTYARSPESDAPLRFQGVAERRFSELTEDALTFGLDYQGETEISDLALLKVKSGFAYSSKDREVSVSRYTNTPITTIDTSQSIDDILSSENINNGGFLYDGATTATDSYNATDNIVAMYLSGEVDMESVSILAGARMENSEQTLEYPNQNSNENTLDESKLLPALSINWRATEETQIRFSATQTVSRPGITERSVSEVYDPNTDDRIIGNPDLEISDITNLDARAEYYFSDDESVTFALFYKDIDAPIERVVGESRDSTTYVNADSAIVQGLEIDFRVNTLDTDEFTGFLSGNLSYVDSEVDLGDGRAAILEGSSSRPLQGQSEYLANIQLGFDHLPSGQSVTLLGNYFDDRIVTVGRGELENEMEDGRTIWDLVYQYDVSDSFTVKGKAKNITDSKVSYSRGSKEVESYYVGSSINISVDYIF